MKFITEIERFSSELRRHEFKNNPVELEIKFGKFIGKRFASDVFEKPFMNFLKLLIDEETRLNSKNTFVQQLRKRGFGKSPHTVSLSTVHIYNNNFRRITYEDGSFQWQKKLNEFHVDNEEYGVRISLNQEHNVNSQEFSENYSAVRNRQRYSFILDYAILDMTIVKQIVDEKIIQKYEVEIELKGSSENMKQFNETSILLYILFLGTDVVYNVPTLNKLKSSLEKYFPNNKRFQDYGSHILVQARNLKKRDVVYGGLVGNPENKYFVTYKADGVRKMLIFHETGIWLAFPPYEFNLISKPIENQNIFNGIVLDGEVVDSDYTKNRFFAFDIICYNGKSSDITKLRYSERKSRYISKIVKNIQKSNILYLEEKFTYPLDFKDPSDFFDVIEQILDNRKNLNYQEDGLMFIPDSEYHPKGLNQPFKNRILTRFADVCKYKDVRDITIDFYVVKLPEGRISLFSSDRGEMKEFTGTNNIPVTPDMIDSQNSMLKDISSGTIVEFEFNSERKLFIPRRIRLDKPRANSLYVAQDNWKDINDPLTDEDLAGKNLSLVFSYQNRIKRGMFNLVEDPRKEYIKILDIGTGRGGDLLKMAGVKARVLAIEPNGENRIELNIRAKNMGLFRDIITLPFGGEETELITEAVEDKFQGEADVVSMMLSLSFFWQTPEMLDKLVETISRNLRNGGKFIFLTIDGDTLEHSVDKNNLLVFSSASYKIIPGNNSGGTKVEVSIPGTIVEDQVEWLVRLDDLTLRLEKKGIVLKELHRASGEKLLTRESSVYTSLYSYGYYERVSNLKENYKEKGSPAKSSNNSPDNKFSFLRNRCLTKEEMLSAKGDNIFPEKDVHNKNYLEVKKKVQDLSIRKFTKDKSLNPDVYYNN